MGGQVRTHLSQGVGKRISEMEISVHLMSDMLPGYSENWGYPTYIISPHDPHPNPQAHQIIADYVIAKILNN